MNKCVLVFLLLSGCTTYQEQFDCPPGLGVGCKSVSHVDRLVERGTLPFKEFEEGSPNSASAPLQKNYSFKSEKPINIGSEYSSVSRTPEYQLRVWLSGYEDAAGNYHSDSFVHTVIKPASWESD